jgi:EAL domain-containing protein (putative c-di-GMP-specific phosphodiesterase class I)
MTEAVAGDRHVRTDPPRGSTLTGRLRAALRRDEFELEFQPIVDPSNERIVGAEALIRWDDPKRGRIHPAQFIPRAEESSLIEDIGDWVLHAACEQTGKWQRQRLPIVVSLNASPRQLRNRRLARSLADATPGLCDARALIVEVTEAVAMDDAAHDALAAVARLGVRVAIDDFGAGYSSFRRLGQLPVHEIKLDRRVLQGTPNDPKQSALVTSFVQLAHNLGADSVIEGVETADQHAFVSAIGPDLAQGYHYAKPLPARKLTARLLAQERPKRTTGLEPATFGLGSQRSTN